MNNNPHFSTYYLRTQSDGIFIIYGNGHAENPSNSLWIVVWPEGFWDA